MRKVVAGLFISLDGVIQSPNQWQFDNFDNEMMAAMEAHLAKEDTILLGRVTYLEWAAYWPNSTDEPYASHINNTPKHVVSTTLNQVEWKNSTLIRGNVPEEIEKLKRQSGKNYLLLRVVAGFLFSQADGLILFGWFGGMPDQPSPLPLLSQTGIGAVLEFFGAIAIMLGLFTHPVAFILSGMMAVTYWQFHAPNGRWPVQNQGMPAVLLFHLPVHSRAGRRCLES